MVNKKSPIWLIVSFLGLLILIYVLFFSSGGFSSFVTNAFPSISKTSATCDVRIVQPLIGSIRIDESKTTCTSKQVATCFLGIIGTSGNLIFESAGLTKSISFDQSRIGLPYGTAGTYSITLCGMPKDTHSGTVKLKVDNKIVSTMGVNF